MVFTNPGGLLLRIFVSVLRMAWDPGLNRLGIETALRLSEEAYVRGCEYESECETFNYFGLFNRGFGSCKRCFCSGDFDAFLIGNKGLQQVDHAWKSKQHLCIDLDLEPG